MAAATVLAVVGPLVPAGGASSTAAAAPPPARPFEPVLQGVIEGDLVVAASTNLRSAGGWSSDPATVADVDADTTGRCAPRRPHEGIWTAPFEPDRLVCGDNSSSAVLDLPVGAEVVAARLYVMTTVQPDVGALRASIDGPAPGFDYRTLEAEVAAPPPEAGATPDGPPPAPKRWEAVAGDRGELRQAVWDVTALVGAAGAGSYTVADIVTERTGPFRPVAGWAIVAAYRLGPGVDPSSVTDPQRFAPRFVSWHEGWTAVTGAPVAVPIGAGPALAQPLFAKVLHVVAGGRRGRSENLLLDGAPLGNSALPGNGAVPGVVVGTDPACNAITDVFNDTICSLGTPVASNVPGPGESVALSDGRTPTSSSGLDVDVTRIPDAVLRVLGPASTLELDPATADELAPSVLAVSIDVAAP